MHHTVEPAKIWTKMKEIRVSNLKSSTFFMTENQMYANKTICMLWSIFWINYNICFWREGRRGSQVPVQHYVPGQCHDDVTLHLEIYWLSKKKWKRPYSAIVHLCWNKCHILANLQLTKYELITPSAYI